MLNAIYRIAIPATLLMLLCSIIWADSFMIGGYRCERLKQADSCYFNTVLFYGGVFGETRLDSVDALFNLADNLGMNVILTRAQRPNTSDITHMSRGQRSVYQAESGLFCHSLGEKICDSDAGNDSAWVTSGSKAGWLQSGLWTDKQYQSYEHNLAYKATFRLKIDANTGTAPICSLLVLRKVDGRVIRETFRILTPQAFAGIGVYDTFTLKFRLRKGEGDKMDYAIWYMGTNDRLYSDHVDVMDTVAYALKTGLFIDDLKTITKYYHSKTAMYRYYLWDEPQPDQYWASSEVNRLLKAENPDIGGIQAMCNKNLLKTYLDSVNTTELFVDCYPLFGDSCKYRCGPTPVDSGVKFQKRIDYMCGFLSSARIALKSYSDKKLWFIPQSFGHGVTDSLYTWNTEWDTTPLYSKTGWWREPSPREMRCMVWLALAYGAKGICYYVYHSSKGLFIMPNYHEYRWVVGLTDSVGAIKRPLWYTIQSINQELDSIGLQLSTLISDTVFKSSDIPSDCFIKDVSDSLMHIGVFHGNIDDYFIIVNRHCLPEDSLEVLVGISSLYVLYLYDCFSQEIIIPKKIMGLPPHYYYNIKLEPGQGKLFVLYP